jgi:hypothetical protein
MVGVVWIFIKDFSLHAHPLIKLTRKDKPEFIFNPQQIQAQEDLKTALLKSPALHTIDYTSSTPIILAVDTSYIAVDTSYIAVDTSYIAVDTSYIAVDTSYIAIGFQLCQCNVTMPS